VSITTAWIPTDQGDPGPKPIPQASPQLRATVLEGRPCPPGVDQWDYDMLADRLRDRRIAAKELRGVAFMKRDLEGLESRIAEEVARIKAGDQVGRTNRDQVVSYQADHETEEEARVLRSRIADVEDRARRTLSETAHPELLAQCQEIHERRSPLLRERNRLADLQLDRSFDLQVKDARAELETWKRLLADAIAGQELRFADSLNWRNHRRLYGGDTSRPDERPRRQVIGERKQQVARWQEVIEKVDQARRRFAEIPAEVEAIGVDAEAYWLKHIADPEEGMNWALE